METVQTIDTSTVEVKEAPKKKSNQSAGKIVFKVFCYIFLTICAIFALLPFYWMIMTSVKSEVEFKQSTPTFFPHVFMWKNYSFAVSTANNLFGRALINTLIVGIISTLLSLIITILTAYAFAKMEFKGKNIVFSLLLASMMIPGELYTTTNYVTVGQSKLGWNNTYIVMIVPFLVSMYYIFLLRNAFKQIPDSLYRAAKVDGLSDLGFLVKVMIPLTAPTLISITLLKFIGTWNSYIWPRLVNTNQEWQLISNWMTRGFADTYRQLYPDVSSGIGTGDPLTTVKMAAACMVSLPLLILFICFRRYIMTGVSKSGTKG